jgi:FkbM family methyltransferase
MMKHRQSRDVKSLLRLVLLRSERLYRISRRLYLLARFIAGRPHERDFEAFRLFGERHGVFLDVGANAGQSALSFRLFNKHDPIISIEANPYHERDLRFLKRMLRRFDYRMCAAGDEDGVITLHIPAYRGVPITGEASVRRESAESSWWMREHLHRTDAEGFSVNERVVPVRRLDDLAVEPAFVKLDVEGFELPVLQGLAATLERHRPILMVERNSRSREIDALLSRLDYRAFIYDAVGGKLVPYERQRPQNLFYLPPATAPAASATPA